MSEVIKNEVIFFGISLLVGIVILFGYDILRAVRKVFPHGNLWLAIEDFIYWTAAGITASCIIFLKNSGIVRGFSLIAIVLGMFLYYKSISRYIVKGISWGLQVITGVIRWILHIITFPVLFLSKKMRKIARKTLKNKIKEVKMILYKK